MIPFIRLGQILAWTYYLTIETIMQENFSFLSKSKIAAGFQRSKIKILPFKSYFSSTVWLILAVSYSYTGPKFWFNQTNIFWMPYYVTTSNKKMQKFKNLCLTSHFHSQSPEKSDFHRKLTFCIENVSLCLKNHNLT